MQEQTHSNFTRGFAALLYMLTAASLVIFNKIALSSYKFPFPNVMVLLQLVFSAVALNVFKTLGLIKYRNFSWDTLKQVMPLSLTFVLFLVAGMVSLQGVNIAMYTALRRLTLVFVMLLDYYLQGKTSSGSVKNSVFVMVLGAFIAAASDLEFNLRAYLYVMGYNLLTALYLVLIARTKDTTHLETFGLMFYNNIVCIPCLAVVCWYGDEISGFLAFPALQDVGFLVSLFFSTVLAFVLNYAIFFNTHVNSALTQSVCGQLKDVLTVLFGVFFVDTVTYSPLNVLGILVSFYGSGVYAKAKYDESHQKNPPVLPGPGWTPGRVDKGTAGKVPLGMVDKERP